MDYKGNALKTLKKRSLLTNTILSYISILLITLFVFVFVIVHYFVREIESQILNAQNQILSAAASEADDLLKQISNIAYSIYFNSDVSTTANYKDPLGRREIIENISNISLNAPGIYDLILYTDESEYMLSRDSTYTFNTLDQLFQFGEGDLSFLDYSKKADKISVFPSIQVSKNNEKDVVIPIVFPDTHKDFSQNRSILYFIKQRHLLNISEDSNYGLLLLDNEGNILGHSNNINNNIKKIEIDKETVNINGVKNYIFIKEASISNILYAILVPKNSIYQTLYNLLFIVCISVIIILICSIIIVAFAIKYNYKPVLKLKVMIEETLGKNFDDYNEVDAISSSINEMVTSIRSFVDFNSNNKSTFREVVLSSILQGYYENIEDLNSFYKYSNIHFRFNNFMVVSLYIQEYMKMDIYGLLMSIEKKYDNFDIYFKNSDNLSIYYAVISFDEENMKEEIISTLVADIEKLGIPNVTYGLSSITADVSQVWCKYMEAVTALDYRLVKGLGSVIEFTEANAGDINWSDYPTDQIEVFGTYLEHGQIEKAVEVIDQIFQYTQKNSSSLFIARCLCFDIIITLMKRVKDVSFKPINTQSFNIMHFETVEQLIEEAKKFCINECQAINNDNYLMKAALDYIKNSFCDPDLSVKNIADHLNISQSALYTLFKENLSTTPLHYINNLQVEKVKELLVTTQQPINTIVQSIGRLDTSNFIRKFKNVVGMTPGEYRKYYGNAK